MEDLEKTEKTGKIRHSLGVWLLLICLAVSLICLVLYILDLNYSDRALFVLLNILRYSSFFLCIFSFYRLIINIYRVFRRRTFNIIIQIFLYIVLIVYGIAIIFLEAFISAVAGGNG